VTISGTDQSGIGLYLGLDIAGNNGITSTNGNVVLNGINNNSNWYATYMRVPISAAGSVTISSTGSTWGLSMDYTTGYVNAGTGITMIGYAGAGNGIYIGTGAQALTSTTGDIILAGYSGAASGAYYSIYGTSGSNITASSGNIIFEVDDLKEASPATVSRNGMVLCEQDTIDCKDLIESYANSLPHNVFDAKLMNQFKENSNFLTKCIIVYIFKYAQFGLPTDRFHLVKCYLEIFECFMKDYKNTDEVITKEREMTSEKLESLMIDAKSSTV
jgi:hypothetical protein